jgi:hypothetical protein
MTPALGITVYHPDKVDHGYTLFAPMTGTSAYLIDMQGRIVHHWALPYRPGAYGDLLDNGRLLVAGRTGKSPVPFGGAGGTLMELDWDGQVLWEYVEDTMHHDFCRLPNGNSMVLACAEQGVYSNSRSHGAAGGPCSAARIPKEVVL